MSDSRVLGRNAEVYALRYLESNQLKLIERNYTTRYGEIDLIMQEDNTIVFVEVRKRSNQLFGGATESIGHNKKKRLIKTAYDWMQKKSYDGNCRFDVVALDKESSPNWIRNAFDVDDTMYL